MAEEKKFIVKNGKKKDLKVFDFIEEAMCWFRTIGQMQGARFIYTSEGVLLAENKGPINLRHKLEASSREYRETHEAVLSDMEETSFDGQLMGINL